jgi:hypothetical protein
MEIRLVTCPAVPPRTVLAGVPRPRAAAAGPRVPASVGLAGGGRRLGAPSLPGHMVLRPRAGFRQITTASAGAARRAFGH